MPTSQSMLNHGFFTPNNATTGLQKNALRFLDVRSYDGDCGYCSIAMALLDYYLHHPDDEASLAKMLEYHNRYFPNHLELVPSTIHAANERMRYLTQNIPMGSFVKSLAYTLRQITVDELCQRPEQYPGSFINEHNDAVPPKTMRNPKTWIHEPDIAALAHALDIEIKVLSVENEKPIPMSLTYNANDQSPSITILFQKDKQHYLAGVYNQYESFAAQTPVACVEHSERDPELDEILNRIAQEDQRLSEVFEETHHRLSALVQDEKLTKTDLINVYIQSKEHSDYLSGRIKYVDDEHKNDYFSRMLSSDQSDFEEDRVPYNDYLVDELVHAIARAIAIGHMDEAVFAPFDADNRLSPR